jgi:hypothetical protein
MIEDPDVWAIEVEAEVEAGSTNKSNEWIWVSTTDYSIGDTAEAYLTPEQARALAAALLVEADRIDPPPLFSCDCCSKY